VGYGEAKGTPVVMKVLVEDVLGPQVLGEDPTRVEFLWEKLYSASRLPLALAHGRPYHRAGSRGETIHAISGVDVALWDISGKSLGVPIYRLLGGGVRDRLPAYASGGWAPPEQTADEVLGYRARGFRGVKIRVGGLDEPHFPQRSFERLPLAREALGPDVQLMMEAHGALTVDRAVRLGESARELELSWFEEPVLADDDLQGLAEVRRRVPMPGRSVLSAYALIQHVWHQLARSRPATRPSQYRRGARALLRALAERHPCRFIQVVCTTSGRRWWSTSSGESARGSAIPAMAVLSRSTRSSLAC
jgi:D-galactarolactone cycloisomerase